MTNHRRKEMQERWLYMLIILATEPKPLSPGRIYFLATGDNRQYGQHRGRPALKAMSRRGWVEEHWQPLYMAIRPGEDSNYSITGEGRAKLAKLGYDLQACEAVRRKWER